MQRGGYGAATSVKRELQPYRGHEKFYFSDPTSDITSNRPLAATEDKTATYCNRCAPADASVRLPPILRSAPLALVELLPHRVSVRTS